MMQFRGLSLVAAVKFDMKHKKRCIIGLHNGRKQYVIEAT